MNRPFTHADVSAVILAGLSALPLGEPGAKTIRTVLQAMLKECDELAMIDTPAPPLLPTCEPMCDSVSPLGSDCILPPSHGTMHYSGAEEWSEE